MKIRSVLVALVVCVLFFSAVNADKKKKKHHYTDGEDIPLWVNTVGPDNNPTETYEFYTLPYCRPTNIVKAPQKMGKVIEGDRAKSSDFKLPFKKSFKDEVLCADHKLNKADVQKFQDAIKKRYFYEMIYDDLSLWNSVGHMDVNYDDATATNPKYYLFKHLEFNILYNEDQVIRINVSTKNYQPQEIVLQDEDIAITFTYSANWNPTDVKFDDRDQFYINTPYNDQEMEIHWLSIMNSVILVILLASFLALIIVKILRSDYARYAREDEEEDAEDYGWKLVHGDVFRFPAHKNIFCAFLGIGVQFISMLVGILFLSLFDLYYPNDGGNLVVSAIALYAVTAVVGGYVSGKMYKQLNGDRWAWNIILTAALFAVPFIAVVAYVNSVAIHFKVTAALPFLTIFEVFVIWALVGFPLTVIGGIAGRRLTGPFYAPCRTKNFPREIPPIPFYRRLPFQMLMAGFLPFSSIYIELLYIYSSVWGHTYYTLFGILIIVFIILNIVTACITVALTYFQLSMEDHRWWWNSFINGGSTGIFIYIYSIFWYKYRSHMAGVLQGSFYFAYMLVVCYFFFILLGSVGFFSSLLFVRKIYANIHSD